MELPNPIPDNPLRWDGWKNYTSENPYERLCLPPDVTSASAQIEDHCRRLLAWWQKKLPLRNQPSNPLSQLLRAGMDEAPIKLAEARMLLLDPAARAEIDANLAESAKESALSEFSKFLSFSLNSGEFGADVEENLYHLGKDLGLSRPEMKLFIDQELHKSGIKRIRKPASAPEVPSSEIEAGSPGILDAAAPSPAPAEASSQEEFLRMLRLSGIDELTDDQRDAFCNMGEALGLTGGEAEDVIDLYLDERISGGEPAPQSHRQTILSAAHAKVTAPQIHVETPVAPAVAKPAIVNSPALRDEERRMYPNLTNSLGMSMLLVTSGVFKMGDGGAGVPNEQPVHKVAISAFYLSRWPVTNAQFEEFEPSHRAKRAAWADENHPVVYVSALEAANFCQWLGEREKRRYRLPSEAEWEYAARGPEGRIFPWGETLNRGNLANFADINKSLPWAHPAIDTGFSETSPAGSFPMGASPFGIEDMAGNVWEWCLDCFAPYQPKDRTNPRGSLEGARRIYRGGSWKSRIASLRASARNFNSPAYSANDVGFRVLCEVNKKSV